MILAGVVAEELVGGAAYGFYRSVTVDHTKCGSSDSTDFPVLVSLTHADLKSVANGGHVNNSSGFDIAFSTDTAGASLIPFDLVFYDGTTGTIEMWVKVSTLSHSTDTVIYLQYGGSASSDRSNRSGCWANGFASVLHLQGDSHDSSGNGLDGTDTAISYAAEEIEEGASFNGTSSGISQGQSATLGEGSAVTISAWVKFSGLPNAYNAVNGKSIFTGGRTLLIKSSGKLAVYVDTLSGRHANYDGSGSNTLSSGTWYYLAMVFDGVTGGNTTVFGYVDGVQDGTGNTSGTSSIGAVGAGGAHETWGHDPQFDPRYIAAVMDELRIANAVRSADWLLAEYNNQNAPGTFVTLGSEVAN